MDLQTEFVNKDIDPFYIGSNAASVSEDGTILATANFEDIVITNLETNEIIHTIDGDDELVTNLVLTPDGTKLGIISQSQQLRVFDVDEGKLIKSFKMTSPVYISTCDSTSSLFAFGGTDGVITIWDIENNYVTHSLKGHGTTISSLVFHGNLNTKDWRLASGDTMGTVKVWDLIKRKCIHTFKEHTSAVRGISFHEDGEFFLTGGRDELIVIYKNFKPIKQFVMDQQIEVAKFINLPQQRSDKVYYFTAGSDNLFKVHELNSEALIYQTTSYKTEEELVIIDVIPLINNEYFVILSDQTLVKIILTDDGVEIKNRIAGNHGIIADLKYVGPEFNFIGLATNSPSLRIVDPKKPLELNICEGHKDLLNVIDVSVDGNWLATGSKDNEARLWRFDGSIQSFKCYAVFTGHIGAVTALSLPRTPINDYPRFLITGSTDLTIKKWKVPKPNDTNEPQIIKTSDYTRRAHEKDINAIDLSPNDEFIGTASYDKTGKIWDLQSGETIGILKGHRRGLWDIKFSKFDKKIITCSGDKTIKLWNLINYQIDQTFEGHTNSIQKIQFINRGSQIVSVGADGLIKVWDNKTSECIKTIDNHSNRIWSLDVKHDGLEFVSGDANGQISQWEDNSEEMKKLKEAQEVERVENDQKLNNLIHQKDYKNAFLVALELNYSMKLFEIIKNLITDDESQLVEILTILNEKQLTILFKKIQNWNINFKNFEISQGILNIMLKSISIEKLSTSGLLKLVDNLIPYNERHLSRLDNLIEQSYILDYSIEQMDV